VCLVIFNAVRAHLHRALTICLFSSDRILPERSFAQGGTPGVAEYGGKPRRYSVPTCREALLRKTTVIAATAAALFCMGSLAATTADAASHRHHRHHAQAVQKPQATGPMMAASDGMLWHDVAGPKVQHGMCWGKGGGKHGEGWWTACK
jgi:hypothetical protein